MHVLQPISLYPLTPEQALSASMTINQKELRRQNEEQRKRAPSRGTSSSA